MIDYALLSPEVNSGRLYAGPGSAPMMANAAAWRALSAEITSAATCYQTVISQLADEEWMGPASASMVAAAEPYIAWMKATASQAEQAATQATTAAAAFETAHAATPPPGVIAANRAQHAQLIATNAVGQNTAAIMANEAHYLEMWAQAAGTMYSYANSSAAAAQVTPFTEPTQTTNPAGTSNQAAAAGQAGGTAAGNTAQTAQMISSMPNAIQGLASPLAAGEPPATLFGLVEAFFRNASINGVVSLVSYPLDGVLSFMGTSVAFTPASLIPTMISFFAGGGFNAVGGGAIGSGLGALLAPGGPLSALGGLGGGAAGAAGAAAAASSVSATTPAVSASMGQASLVGSFSAPASWAEATPAGAGTAAATAVNDWAAAPVNDWDEAPESHSIAAMPPGMAAAADRGGFGLSTPRYGFKPTVMPRPVIAG